jgi:transposase
MLYNVPPYKRPAYQRHDISDKVWERLAPLLPWKQGKGGSPSKNDRNFINAVFWILRTGAPWRDLPPSYGNWNSIAKRFRRWVKGGVWERILEVIVDCNDFKWLIIDATFVKVHKHGHGAKGGNQEIGRTKGGQIQRYILPWTRLVVSSEYLLQKVQQQIANSVLTS